MRKWILWLPVLMVGSLVYWTIALNFGGLSLIALTSLSIDSDGLDGDAALGAGPSIKDSYQSITVSFPDPGAPSGEGVDETAGAAARTRADDDSSSSVTVDVVSDHEPGSGEQSGAQRANQGPGDTAF